MTKADKELGEQVWSRVCQVGQALEHGGCARGKEACGNQGAEEK